MSELTTQSRPPSGRATPQKKGSYEGSGPSGGSKATGGPASGSGFEGYYGADENHWWDDENYNQTAYYDNGYYDEYGEGSGVFEIFEVDLYSMLFVLDENLEPKDIYNGFEIDDKSLVFSLEADEIQDQMPVAWRSAPLKIHPEPVNKPEKKDTPQATVLARSASTGGLSADANEGGGTPVASNAVSVGGSPAPGTQGKDQASQSDAAQTPKTQSRALPEQSVATIASTVVEEIASGQQSPTTPGDASDSRNPRIVISSSQLEHLKLKMQVLKQRRGGSDEAEAKEASPAPATAPAAAARTVFSNCPGCHGLKFFITPDPGWWCSGCGQEFPQGAPAYGCRVCDHDECEKCAMTQRPAPDEKQDASSSSKVVEKPATVTAEVPAQSSSTSNRASAPSKATRKATQKTSASSSSSSAPAPATRRTATAVATRSRSRSNTRPGSTSDSGPSPSPSPAPSVAKKKKKKNKDEAGKKVSKKEESKKESKKTESKKEAAPKTTRDKVKVKKKVASSRHASKNATKSSDEDEDPPEKEPSKKKVKKVREVKRSTKETKAATKTTEKSKTDDRRDSRSRRGASASSASSKRSRRETVAVTARRKGSSESEEDPPPRKRAANTLTTERDASRNTPAVNLLRAAPVTSRRDETSRPKLAANDEVGPTRTVTQRSSASDSARTQTTLRRNSEPDLLRRVLRAQASATQAPKRAGSKEGEPRATLLPPSARKDADAASPPRGPAATLRPPNRFGASGGSKKADMKVSRRG